MNNSQKGFIIPLLLVIIALLLIAGGTYVYKNSTAISTTQAPPSGSANWQAYFDSETPPATPIGIVLPQNCFVVGVGDKIFDLAYNTFAGFKWKIDCGPQDNRQARATLAPTLKQQGWTECDSGLATASWWMNGVILVIAEADPIQVTQTQGTSQAAGCQAVATSTAQTMQTAQPSITILSPNGGESWQIGSTQTIRWSSNFSGGVVSISLVSDYYNPNTEDHR